MKNTVILFFVLCLLLLVGCSNKVKLTGKVTYSDDDTPLSIGTVCFETDTYLAWGALKPDGTYVVGSLSEKDGIPPGKYRVYISGAVKYSGADSSGKIQGESLIDENLTNGTSTPLEFEVTPSAKVFNFKVDRYVSEKKKGKK